MPVITLSISESAFVRLHDAYFARARGDATGEAEVAPGLLLSLERKRRGGRWEHRLQVDAAPEQRALLDVLLGESWRVVPDAVRDVDLAEIRDAGRRIFDALFAAAGAAPAPHRFVADAGYAAVRCAASAPPDETIRYLAPYLTCTPRDDGGADLVALGDPGLFHRADEAWSAYEWQSWNRFAGHPKNTSRGDGYAFFELDGGRILGRFRMPLFPGAGQTFYLREGAEGPWYLLYDPESRHSRHALARTIRVLGSHFGARRGAVCVHASAFALGDGAAYVLCGSPRAGKTTNLLAALERVEGAELVANDRVFITVEDGAAVVRGYPHQIGVRAGTMLVDAELGRRLLDPAAGGDFDHALAGAEGRRVEPQIELSRFFQPAELAARLGTTVRTRARLAGVVLLRSDAGDGAPWTPMEGSRIGDTLGAHLQPHYDNAETFWTDVLGPPARTIGPALAQALRVVEGWELRSYHRLDEAWRSFGARRRSGG